MLFKDIQPLEGFDPEIGLLLATLVDSTREWRLHLGELPEEAIVWQAAPDSYSVGGLLLHLIDVEDFWFRNFAAGEERTAKESALLLSDETDQGEGNWPVPPLKPLSWYFDLHDRVRARAIESIKGISPDQTFERPDWEREYTFRWLVAHVLQHDSYTGGQAVAISGLWLRLMS